MRWIPVSACAALCSLGLLACANENQQPPPAPAPQQAVGPTVDQQARQMLLAADLQLKDLKDARDNAANEDQRDAIGRQMAQISLYRDRLLGDLATSRPDSPMLRRDVAHLQRVMHGGAAAAEPQAPTEQQAPVEPAPQQPQPDDGD